MFPKEFISGDRTGLLVILDNVKADMGNDQVCAYQVFLQVFYSSLYKEVIEICVFVQILILSELIVLTADHCLVFIEVFIMKHQKNLSNNFIHQIDKI